MRARWLKPEFFTDKKIAQLDPMTALIYQALWCWADDGGTVQADPDLLKAHVFFRWSAVTVRTISGALRELSALGRIDLYQVGDDLYANICNWKRHQSVHKPSKFRYPQKREGVAVDSAALFPEDSPTSAEIPTARILESYSPRILESTPHTQSRDEGDDPGELALAPANASFRLAPYLAAHTERFPGSTPPAGRFGRTFKRLEKKHGADETLRRWKICLARKGTFATPEELAAHWSEYESERAPAADPFAHLAGYPDLVIDGELTEYGERVTRPGGPVRGAA